MLNNIRGKDYSQLSLNDFSDDDSDNDLEDNTLSDNPTSIRNRQELLLKQQDAGLEMLGQSADRLGKMSLMISEELHSQNQLLDEMDTTLDEATENLSYVTQKTKDLVKQAGGTKNCMIIAVLSLVIVVLILLILYT